MIDHPDHTDILDRLARVEEREKERLRQSEERWQEHRRQHAEVKATLGEIKVSLKALTNNHHGQAIRERMAWGSGGISVPIIIGAIGKAAGWW